MRPIVSACSPCFAAVGILLAGCGQGGSAPTDDGQDALSPGQRGVPVTIEVAWPELTRTIPAGTAKLAITVTAADLDTTITAEIPAGQSRTVIYVPAGDGRTFRVEAQDANGVVLAWGELTDVRIVHASENAVPVTVYIWGDGTITVSWQEGDGTASLSAQWDEPRGDGSVDLSVDWREPTP